MLHDVYSMMMEVCMIHAQGVQVARQWRAGSMHRVYRWHTNPPTSSFPSPKIMRNNSCQIRCLHSRFALGFDGLADYKFLTGHNSLERTQSR